MKFLVIGDPIDSLIPKTDTGLAIVRVSLARGHELYWSTAEEVSLGGARVEARARGIVDCQRGRLPAVDALARSQPVAAFDAVWIRKDPPMDWKYVSLCWLLTMEQNETVIVNRPSLLLEYHEKMVPFRAFRAGYLRENEIISTHLVTGPGSPLPAEEKDAQWISKPWLGHGGRGVSKWESLALFRSQALRELESGQAYSMLQRFYPQVQRTGDRRLFYIAGTYAGGFVRIPAPGAIKANLASGGTAVLREITPSELDTAKRLGEYLRSIGIVLAGADMIDGRITEVNITAPTGFEALFELEGRQPVEQLVAFVERLVSSRGVWPAIDPSSAS
ncbi:MAG: hypothetical protein JXA30_08295 [Deltaproteobacteria bacterium]|nr:hypothetical protein [Deltaproteobacteria bacterium]